MWLTRFAISRPVIVLLATVGLMVFGLASYFSLGRNLFPNVEFPAVFISAGYPGASPSEMERLIVKPIEDQLNGMQNLKQINATAQEGFATVFVQFQLGTNLDTAANDAQQRVQTARAFMPSDLDPPIVERQNQSSEPIVIEALRSNQMTGPELGDLVNDRIVSEIKAIPGVQNVGVNGQPSREFHVLPEQQRLLAAGYTLNDLLNSIANNNFDLPGGRVDTPTSETSVSVRADVNSAQDIANIPLFNQQQMLTPGANPLHIGDLATVEDSHVEQRAVSHFDGTPAVYLDIQRETTSDTVKTTVAVREGLKKIAAEYPRIHFQEIEASADYTEASINGVLQSLFEGIVLTALVMLLFLHAWRNAVVVMVAIPTSLLATFIMMRALGFTVDIISMMGLGLTIGILVDDSIVVLENITRHRDMGEEPTNAAINGRTEIGNAAIAITLVDVIVFTPIAFMSGIVGEFMREFGLVIVVATLFSLIVSFTLTPLLAARWSVRRRSTAPPRYLAWFQRGFDALQNWYSHRALPLALHHGYLVGFTCSLLVVDALTLPVSPQAAVAMNLGIFAVMFVVSLVALALSIPLRGMRERTVPGLQTGRSAAWTMTRDFAHWLRTRPVAAGRWCALSRTRLGSTAVALSIPLVLAAIFMALPKIGFEFIPSTPTGVVNVSMQFPEGAPLANTQAAVDRLEQRYMKIAHVETVLSTSGTMPSGYGSLIGGNYAKLTVITYKSARDAQDQIAEIIRTISPPFAPGAKIIVSGENGGGSGSASPIFYNIIGPDSLISSGANRLAQFIRTIPGAVDVQTSEQTAAPRLTIHIDPERAALLGINPGQAATAARIALGGAVATKVRTDLGLVDVRLQLPYNERNDIGQIRRIKIRSNSGALVDLGSVADFYWAKAPTKVDRQDRHRIISVTAQIDPKSHLSVGDVMNKVQAQIKKGLLPSGVSTTSEGDTQLAGDTANSMGTALFTSAVLVYMLMVILYGSFLEPFIIMFSIPVAIVGALAGLSIHHQTLNLFSMIGIVMLFGLVAKNGILLVDYTNTLHAKRGMPVTDALLTAAKTRFRPIIMTTCAMIFGMLPLALGLTEGARSRSSMGTVLIGGLLSSLILTLFLVPMVYNTWIGYLARLNERVANRRAIAAEMQPETVPAH